MCGGAEVKRTGFGKTVILCITAAAMCGCSGTVTGSSWTSPVSSEASDSVSTGFSADIKPDTPYLEYLGSRTDIRESGAYALYKKSYSHNGEDIIGFEYVNPSELMDKLYERRAADLSPDLTDKPEQGIFQYMASNYYEDLTGYIDVTSPQWAGYEEYIRYYEIGGARFFFPEHIEASPRVLIYDADIFREYGMQDPTELLDNGQWNWYTFEQLTRQFSAGSRGGCGVTGEGISEAFLSSTGVRLFNSEEGGKTEISLGNEKISAALEYMHGMSDILLHETSDFGTGLLNERRSAFVLSDRDYYNSVREEYPDMNIRAVPFPAAPGTEAFYTASEAVGFLVPKGAKNIKGAACFINLGRIESEILENNSDESDYFTKPADMKPVLSEFYCLDKETNDSLKRLFSQIVSDRERSVEEICGEYASAIDNAVQDFNALVV